MRVLLSCLQGRKRYPLPPYEHWRRYFVEGCREAEIEYVEVPDVDWVEGMMYPLGDKLLAWKQRTWEAVLAFVQREHARRPIDFFLGYLYPVQITPAAIVDLQRLGIPCVNFFCDNVREFRVVPPEYRPFALHWVPEFEALTMYRRAGLPHIFAPMPCWIPPELRSTPRDETEPPTFIGSSDILRRDLLGRAIKAGADIFVRGTGWEIDPAIGVTASKQSRSLKRILINQCDLVRAHGVTALLRKLENHLFPLNPPLVPTAQVGPAVPEDDYFRVTREAVVTIGVNRVPTARTSNHRPITYSRLRDLEAPMVGACYLTEWTEGLSKLYEIGKEIEAYRTPEELAAKVSDLKGDPIRRRAMRKRGQRRALEEHSVARSLKLIARRVTSSRAT